MLCSYAPCSYVFCKFALKVTMAIDDDLQAMALSAFLMLWKVQKHSEKWTASILAIGLAN